MRWPDNPTAPFNVLERVLVRMLAENAEDDRFVAADVTERQQGASIQPPNQSCCGMRLRWFLSQAAPSQWPERALRCASFLCKFLQARVFAASSDRRAGLARRVSPPSGVARSRPPRVDGGRVVASATVRLQIGRLWLLRARGVAFKA